MSSGFISEAEIAERRRVRQEEWEKVRQPNQPLEAPEEEYDHRSLYDRLQEQKQKKEFEYEEAHRLKNMIKGLDDDEVEFLDLVDRSKLEEERKKTVEEEREMADFRNKVASLQEKSLEQRIQQEIRQPLKVNNNINSGRTSQTKLLAGAVVKKRPSENSSDKERGVKRPFNGSEDKDMKRPSDDSNKKSSTEGDRSIEEPTEKEEKNSKKKCTSEENSNVVTSCPTTIGSLRCIGILPGLGTYNDSSAEDSDESTDVEDNLRFDLLGRKIKKKDKSLSSAE
ncbi:hypothetical protein AAG570_009921 [Ranatra chinensis]|uniref:FAM192A/Fyv6 N-terminal domain-containing protein n=1 Tax=Ranatra chinensis TaxID=642074 RepID=A0ABD0Z3G8_9HEMI